MPCVEIRDIYGGFVVVNSKGSSKNNTFGHLWIAIRQQKPTNFSKSKANIHNKYFLEFQPKMELCRCNNSARNSDLGQILAKAVNSDDIFVLFASPSEFKGDHWAPKGPQRAPKRDPKMTQIDQKFTRAALGMPKGVRGYPPGASEAPNMHSYAYLCIFCASMHIYAYFVHIYACFHCFPAYLCILLYTSLIVMHIYA